MIVSKFISLNRIALLIILLIAILISGISVVYVHYEYRKLYNYFQTEKERYNLIQAKRSQLLIEYSVLSSPENIEKQAMEELNMIIPSDLSIKKVSQ